MYREHTKLRTLLCLEEIEGVWAAFSKLYNLVHSDRRDIKNSETELIIGEVVRLPLGIYQLSQPW